jgi:hypothetical protein
MTTTFKIQMFDVFYQQEYIMYLIKYINILIHQNISVYINNDIHGMIMNVWHTLDNKSKYDNNR